jgi:hypothetical protein
MPPRIDAGRGVESQELSKAGNCGATRLALVNAPLNFQVPNPGAGLRITNEVSPMFEVTRYDHPHIFVTRRRTGETYKFSIRSDGDLTHPEANSGQGVARQVAVEWLAQRVGSRELEFA